MLRSLATLHLMQSDFDSALEIGRELLVIAEQQRDPMLLSDAHLVYGTARGSYGSDEDGGPGWTRAFDLTLLTLRPPHRLPAVPTDLPVLTQSGARRRVAFRTYIGCREVTNLVELRHISGRILPWCASIPTSQVSGRQVCRNQWTSWRPWYALA